MYDVAEDIKHARHFLPLHRLTLFGADATVGEVLATLRERRQQVAIVAAKKFRIADVATLLKAALAHVNGDTSAVRDVKLALILDALPDLGEVKPSTRRDEAFGLVTRLAREHGFALIRSSLGALGLFTLSEDTEQYLNTSAYYWECPKGCLAPTKPPTRACVPHREQWTQTT